MKHTAPSPGCSSEVVGPSSARGEGEAPPKPLPPDPITLDQQVRESEALYHSLVENLPQNVFRKDLSGRFTFANTRFCQTVGCGLNELVGKTDFDLFPRELADKYRRDDLYIMETGEPLEVVEAHQPPHGDKIYVQVVKSPLRNAAGAVIGIQGIFWDITERKRAEERLVLNEARLDALVRLNQLQTADMREIALFAMEEAVKLTRSTAGYLAFTSADETALSLYAWSSQAAAQCAAHDKPVTYPIEATGLWGEAVRQRRPVISNNDTPPAQSQETDPHPLGGAPLRRHMSVPIFQDARIVAVAGVGNKEELYDETDVRQLTLLMEGMWRLLERKRADEALRQSEANLALAQRMTQLGSWQTDLTEPGGPDQRHLSWSDEVYRIFGFEPGAIEATREQFLKAVHPDDRPIVEAAVAAALRDRTPYQVDHRVIRPDGSIRVVHEHADVVCDPVTGVPSRLVGTVQDVTERRQIEDQLRRAQKMEAIGQLAGGIAHDFNNILTVVKGHLGLLIENPLLAPEFRESLREVEAAANRAAKLTRQLLTFSRRQVLRASVVDLNEVVSNMYQLLHRLLGEQVALECRYAPDLPALEADASLLEQVIMNLAVNARDAMPRGGRLTLQTSQRELGADCRQQNPERRPGRFVLLAVSDTGEGMDDTTIKHMFEPFFTTKEVGKGTGLGLATVYGIVKQHQGWVEVKSAVGIGSEFAVFFPASAIRARPSATPRSPARPVRGSETVLLVEDEAAVRALASLCLRRLGYRVIEASSGPDALRVWHETAEPIHLLLTDMVMPQGMNGHELASTLLKENPNLKVVYASGYGVEGLRHELGLVEGMNYVPKPYDPVLLASTVRKCLDTNS